MILVSFSSVATAGAENVADGDPQSGVLPAGSPNFDLAELCVPYDACPEMEGVTYAHVDISQQMEQATDDDDPRFWLDDSVVDETALWLVCTYDGDGRALDCYYDDERGWGFNHGVGTDVRELRLFPIHSAATGWQLTIQV